MPSGRSIVGAATVGLVLVVGSQAPAPASGTANGRAHAENGRIVYMQYDQRGSEEEPRVDLFSVDPDGGEPQQLTDDSAWETGPSWSPDGTEIAFVRRTGRAIKDMSVYVMDADGSNVRQLTDHPKKEYSPTWSPSGRKIAFISDRSGSQRIYTVRSDGTSERAQLVSKLPADDIDWSPAAPKLAVALSFDNIFNGGLRIVDLRTGKTSNVIKGKAGTVEWGPGGRVLAWESDCCNTTQDTTEARLIRADGENDRPVPTSGTPDHYWRRISWGPVWAPDGSGIAYVIVDYIRSGPYEIRVASPDGSSDRVLVEAPAVDDRVEFWNLDWQAVGD